MRPWEVITKRLHSLGGGPLRLMQFDYDFAGYQSAAYAIKTAAQVGSVQMIGPRATATWSLTPVGVDYCNGVVILQHKKSSTAKEDQAGRAIRIDRLIQESTEAASVCASLTDKQRAVLVLVAKGFTLAETSERLGAHVAGVESHMRRIMQAIGCTRYIEAAVIAAKAGLV